MGGESGNSNIKFQNAPLMSNRQLDMLDQMLFASGNAIQDFRFGAPYRGPFYSGYSPREFHLGGGYSGYHDPWKREREGDGEEKKRKREEDEGGRNYPNQGFQGQGMGSYGGGGWASLLGSGMGGGGFGGGQGFGGMGGAGGYTGSYGGGRMGQGFGGMGGMSGFGGMGASDLGFYNTYMPQMMTSPFVNPFRQGMTGNYPRMGSGGGGWASVLGGR